MGGGRGGAALSTLILLPSEKGFTLKGTNSFLLEYTPFQNNFGLQDMKREVT